MKNKHDNKLFPVTYPNFSQDKKKYKYKKSRDKRIKISIDSNPPHTQLSPFSHPLTDQTVQLHTIKKFR